MPLMRAWAGQLEAQEFMDAVNGMELLKEWLPVIEPFKSRIPKLRSTKETADLALEIYRALKDKSAPPPPPPSEDGEGDEEVVNDHNPLVEKLELARLRRSISCGGVMK